MGGGNALPLKPTLGDSWYQAVKDVECHSNAADFHAETNGVTARGPASLLLRA